MPELDHNKNKETSLSPSPESASEAIGETGEDPSVSAELLSSEFELNWDAIASDTQDASAEKADLDNGFSAPSQPAASGPVRPIPNLKRKKKFPWKRLIAAVVIVAVGAIVVQTFFFGDQQVAATNYTEATVEKRDLTIFLDGTGTLQAADSADVTALLSAKITALPFEEGALVAKDTTLVTMDDSDVRNSISRLQLSLENAQDTYAQLVKTKSDLTIVSTASGVIESLLIEKGDMVTAGTAVAVIADRSTMLLKVPFFSADADLITMGASAVVTMDGTYETLHGTVDSVSALEQVGVGGTVLREVTIRVSNPGGLSADGLATAQIGEFTCSDSGAFSYLTDKTVLAKASGEVTSVSVKEGDAVSNGQTLGALKSDDLDAQIRSAQRNISDSKLSLQSTQDQLDNYVIKAPISGTLVQVDCAKGDTATPGVPLMTIYDLSYLTFDMYVDELDINMVSVGQEVEITTDALPNDTFIGIVEKVSLVGTTVGGVTSYPVTVRIDAPGDLIPGMNVSANINIGTYDDALTVPVDAVTRGNTVLVSSESASAADGEEGEVEGFSRITIGLGANDDYYIIVTEGLKEGDTIAIINQSGSSMMEMMMGMGG